MQKLTNSIWNICLHIKAYVIICLHMFAYAKIKLHMFAYAILKKYALQNYGLKVKKIGLSLTKIEKNISAKICKFEKSGL